MARQRSAGGGYRPPPAEPPDDRQSDADPEAIARTICLRLLTVRARTRVELATALSVRNVPEVAARSVLDRLTSAGLINDRAFADDFVESRHRARGLAARELSRQLRSKGVDAAIVAEAVAELDPGRERAMARGLVERKLPSMIGLDRQVQTRRLAGLLARKGYSPEIAFQVVREVIYDQVPQLDEADEAWLDRPPLGS